MGKIILGFTISLDGFINDKIWSVADLYSDLDTLRYSEPMKESKGEYMAKVTAKKHSTSDLPIDRLAAPAQRALANAGIKNLNQLAKFSEAEVKEFHGIGPNALLQLRAALKAKGLSFKEEIINREAR